MVKPELQLSLNQALFHQKLNQILLKFTSRKLKTNFVACQISAMGIELCIFCMYHSISVSVHCNFKNNYALSSFIDSNVKFGQVAYEPKQR